MKTSLKLKIIAAIVCMSAEGANSQLSGVAPLPQMKSAEGPTLEATLQWLDIKLKESSAFKVAEQTADNRKEDIHSLDYIIEGCNLDIIKTIKPKKNNGYFSGYKYEISTIKLKDLDSDKLSIHQYGNESALFLTTTGNIESVHRIILSQVGARQAGLKTQSELSREYLKKKLKILKTVENPFSESKTTYITQNDSNGWGIYRQDMSIVFINTINVEISERMKAAFKRAIHLCQQSAAKEKISKSSK